MALRLRRALWPSLRAAPSPQPRRFTSMRCPRRRTLCSRSIRQGAWAALSRTRRPTQGRSFRPCRRNSRQQTPCGLRSSTSGTTAELCIRSEHRLPTIRTNSTVRLRTRLRLRARSTAYHSETAVIFPRRTSASSRKFRNFLGRPAPRGSSSPSAIRQVTTTSRRARTRTARTVRRTAAAALIRTTARPFPPYRPSRRS